MRLFAELRRRNVIRMAGLYLVGAWLVTQVAATLLPTIDAPGWVMKVLVVLLALIAVIAADRYWPRAPLPVAADSAAASTEALAVRSGRLKSPEDWSAVFRDPMLPLGDCNHADLVGSIIDAALGVSESTPLEPAR